VSNEPALHTAYFKLIAWNCSFHALARQSRCGESQEVRGVDFGTAPTVDRMEPAFAKRLRRGSLRLLCYDRVEAGLPSRSLRSKRRLVVDANARNRSQGYQGRIQGEIAILPKNSAPPRWLPR
jgi:hypothetical protein